uniref:Reverse transcriptase domain-containing protein n=1 Tax=Tanacetum cinerariifolium TaxID=118510 RepID=A0A6L2KB09_TANCI|nr:reverse transcriptase domain-containing protein [Tanacetum cinerariifolium]
MGILLEVEPLEKTQLEDLGLNTCNHDIPISSREVSSFDEPKPQPQPLRNCPSLDVSLGDKRGPKPPTKPPSPDSFRMKVLDNLTIHTPPSSLVASFHPKDTYCYYHPCIDDPKKYYGFKPVAPVSAPMPNLKPSIPYPSRRDNEKRCDQANEQIEKFYEIFKDMSFEISFTDALTLMSKFASTLKALIRNKEKLIEMARTPMNEHCSAVILNKLP